MVLYTAPMAFCSNSRVRHEYWDIGSNHDNVSSMHVYLSHSLDLSVPLKDVALIDIDYIYLQESGRVFVL